METDTEVHQRYGSDDDNDEEDADDGDEEDAELEITEPTPLAVGEDIFQDVDDTTAAAGDDEDMEEE